MRQRQGPNYNEIVAQFTGARDGRRLGVMAPSKRNFTAAGGSDHRGGAFDARRRASSISRLATAADGSIAVRLYHKPMVLLIWLGPVLMAFGGMLSLSDRRLRVGAPRPARALRGLQAAE